MKNRIRKLKKEIERNNSKELIIGRTKGNEEVPNQIDTSTKEFQELEEDKEIAIGKEEELIPDYLKGEIHFATRKWKFQEEMNDPW